VPHQVCEFHVVKEVVKAVLSAVASARKTLAAKQPKSAQGAPGDAGGESRQPKRKSGWNSSGLTCSRIGISSSSVT